MPLTLRQFDGGFGAEVTCDLTALTAQLALDLADALAHHRFLVVPGQHLNHADLLRAAGAFGPVDTDVDRAYAVGGFPGLTTISNIVEDGARVGVYDGDQEEEWHADNSFKPALTRATLLYSVIAPQRGGETRLADSTRAYADLPTQLKEEIDPLRAVHSIRQLAALQGEANDGASSAAAGHFAREPEVEHPLVLVHPLTGARSLLVGTMVVKEIRGLAPERGADLLAQLLQRATAEQYVYRHRWTEGDVLVWDNLATLHTASPCDSSRHQRLLYRASVN